MAIEGPRALRPAEVTAAIRLADKVFRPDGRSSMGDEFPLLLRAENADDVRVFADGDRIVSLIGMLRSDVVLGGSRHTAEAIGSVCTDPDYRGQGLATRLLGDCREKAVADGADMFLISGGRGLYRRLGFVDVGGYCTATVTRKALPKASGCVLRPWTPDDVQDMTALHAAEGVRFVRTPEDFLAYLRTGVLCCVPSETQLVCAKGDGRPVAYVAYQIGGAPWEEKDADAVTVGEMAGPRWAIVQALGPLMDARGIDALDVYFLDADAEMAELARTLGWETRRRGFRGTVGIIEPERFWQRCAQHLSERLGARTAERLALAVEGGTIRVSLGNESVELDGMAGITKLVFLPAHRRGELDLGLPEGSALAAALQAAFPLPLVDYGLNYV